MRFSVHGNAIYHCENASVFMLMKSRTWKAGLRQQNYSGKHFNAN